MADPRFFSRAGPFTLKEICAISGARRARDATGAVIRDVAPLDQAGEGEMSFLDNRLYRKAFLDSSAQACLCREKDRIGAPERMELLISKDPYLAYAKVAAAFYPDEDHVDAGAPDGKGDTEGKRRSSTARIDPTATIGSGCRIADWVVIGPGVRIGDDTHIGAYTRIARGVVIGAGGRIASHVGIECALIGEGVRIDSGARIGQGGFGFAWDPDTSSYRTVPQLGRVVIDDDAHIGANTTIDRGSGPDTRIGTQCRIDNLVQIAHNVVLGKRCVIVAQVGISGSSVIGDDTHIGGQAGLSGHLRIGSQVRIAAKSGIMRSIHDGGAVGGIPAVPLRQWHRQTRTLADLAAKKTAGKRRRSDES